jgi:UDP-N-acetyl-D-glucosamine dehydrogenase
MDAASAVVAVIGMGYAGLQWALHSAESPTRAAALDIDPAKVSRLNAGESYISHVPASRVQPVSAKRVFAATTDFECLRDAAAALHEQWVQRGVVPQQKTPDSGGGLRTEPGRKGQ